MIRTVRAAGGLLLRLQDEPEVLLVAAKEEWRIPKGIVEHQECDEEAAIREVLEETGILAAIFAEIATRSWTYEWQGSKWRKNCRFFAMAQASDDVEPMDAEFDRAEWLSIDDAHERLTYAAEREVLGVLRALLPRFRLLQREAAPHITELSLVARGVSHGNLAGSGKLGIIRGAADPATTKRHVVAVADLDPALAPLVVDAQALLAAKGGTGSPLAVAAQETGTAVVIVPNLELRGATIRLGAITLPEGADVSVLEGDASVRLATLGMGREFGRRRA